MLNLILGQHSPLEHVTQKPLKGFWTDNPFTSFTYLSNHIVMQVICGLLLALLVPWALRRRAAQDAAGHHIQTGFLGNAIEWLCLWLRENVARPALGVHTDRFIPYLWTVFFFILFSNFLGMIPLDVVNHTLFGGKPVLGGTSTGNVWVTATLALCTLFMISFFGLKAAGVGFLKHFFSIGPFPLNIAFGFLEIVGLFARIFALTIRLFANMLAGHVLLAVLIGFMLTMSTTIANAAAFGKVGGGLVMIIILVGSLAVSAMELVLVVPLQALIFTLLTAVFIGQAVNVHHEEEHGFEHGHELDHNKVMDHVPVAHG
jgi:F-type H+-transporting ATPase subunit a